MPPGPMAQGNITVGLIIDTAASDAQADAIAAIASGQAGGPLAALSPLVGKMAGIERGTVTYEAKGLNRAARADGLVDQACEGFPGGNPDEAICLDNVGHPIANRLALAKATRSVFNAFGVKWDDKSGTKNALYAPFAWTG